MDRLGQMGTALCQGTFLFKTCLLPLGLAGSQVALKSCDLGVKQSVQLPGCGFDLGVQSTGTPVLREKML